MKKKNPYENTSLTELTSAILETEKVITGIAMAWPDLRPLVEWLEDAVSDCDGMRRTVGTSVVSPGLKKVAQTVAGKIPKDLKKNLEKNFELEVEVVRRRFPMFNYKTCALLYVVADFNKWLNGMFRPAFVPCAYNLLKAEKMGFDVFGLNIVEAKPEGGPLRIEDDFNKKFAKGFVEGLLEKLAEGGIDHANA